MEDSNTLKEGLSRKSLDYLIQPLLSIDEYCSKISDKRAIVIGFFITELDPANDLSDFIDRSSLPILDTETSPAPTIDGYFMVFVEVQRDEKFPETLLEMLKEVNNLTSVEIWTFQCPSHEEALEVNEKNLKKFLVLSQDLIVDQDEDDEEEDDNEKEVKESREFWQLACLDSIEINENIVTFFKYNNSYRYKILNESPNGSIGFSFESDTRNLQSLLGPSYNVWSMNDKLVVEHCDEYKVLQNLV